MKRIYCLFLLIALSQSGVILAQDDAETTQDLLVGAWKFNYSKSFNKMEADLKVQFDSIATTQRNMIRDAYKGRKITFNADGSFIQTLKDGRSVAGTWKVTKNGKKVKIKGPNGNSYTQKIKKLNPTQLVLKQENNGLGRLFFPEWHFIKN